MMTRPNPYEPKGWPVLVSAPRLPYAMRLAAAGWRVVVSHEPALGLVD